MYCSVKNCKCGNKIHQISMFRLPKNKKIREFWCQNLNIKENLKDIRICEAHFDPSSFISTFRNSKPIKVLKPNAIPKRDTVIKKIKFF